MRRYFRHGLDQCTSVGKVYRIDVRKLDSDGSVFAVPRPGGVDHAE